MTKCILCDKEINPKGITVVGKQTGNAVHGDCYKTWLIEKMRGKDT